MKLSIETKPALWGAAGGAAAPAILGFGWGMDHRRPGRRDGVDPR